MNEQGYRFGVGVLVVASLVIAVILILFFGAAPNLFVQRYTVTIRFDAAPGVTTDTPVRKNGVQIGRVKSVQLLDEDGVDLTLELDSQYKVLARELPRIGTGSIITGDAVVEFVPATQASLVERFDGLGGSPKDGRLDTQEEALTTLELKDKDYFRGGTVMPNPLDAFLEIEDTFATTLDSIAKAGTAIENAGNQVAGLAEDARQAFQGSDGDVQEIAQRARATIDNFNQTLTAIRTVFADPKLRDSVATLSTSLPTLVSDAQGVMSQAKGTLARFEQTAANVETSSIEAIDRVSGEVEATIHNLNEFTRPFGEQGNEFAAKAYTTLDNFDRLLVDLRSVSASIDAVADRINNGQGTVAKLIDDPQLYYSLDHTLRNIAELTHRLRPVVESARVFTSKIERDPASIVDLRGALIGRPRGGVK